MDQAPGNSTISRLLMQQGATSTESMQLEEALGAGKKRRCQSNDNVTDAGHSIK
jgi:hypothetical protein